MPLILGNQLAHDGNQGVDIVLHVVFLNVGVKRDDPAGICPARLIQVVHRYDVVCA